MISNLIIKAASNCNLACTYCYFAQNTAIQTDQPTMSIDTVRQIFERTATYCDSHEIQDFIFCWHGGEPLLAGQDFYDKVVKLQAEIIPPEVTIENAIQSNGLLLNDRWIDFFKRHDFQLALSLDGPAAIHDRRRVTKKGRGTHRYVQDRIKILKKNNYPVRLLAVISPESTQFGVDIYKYFRELDCEWMDFMYPICNWVKNTLDEDINVENVGQFYCDVFDAWISEGDPIVYIRSLHDIAMLLLGGRTVTCHTRTDCSYVLTINTDGRVHICDDLMSYADSDLGHIAMQSLDEIEENTKLSRLQAESVLFGNDCLNCDYFTVCKGGCTLFRAKGIGDYTARNYYCVAQRMMISHVKNVLEAMAENAIASNSEHFSSREAK